ncbi:MAG TPA: mechanosensitive ion channel domain-containing protein [Stackebrandtia sp.]|uniref:mechanosensitive ion channel family protein n=1 Tax=Stackebrandtia sp. TaxID=2023065 RepID=UPI002D21EF28|nr:mechanosensitive ion channel domain-containing protein [Stackebrandtia sp.]HZE38175.1 mechanosensitive ion channel domain-containing protein [Stackebrandtia sp.]
MNNIAPALLVPAVAAAAVLITIAARLTLRIVLRRSPKALNALSRLYRPTQALVALATARGAMELVAGVRWYETVSHALLLLCIAAAAWLGTRLAALTRQTVERRYLTDDETDNHARLRRTQVTVIYRAGYAAIWLVAVGIMFLTFPGARALGASLLASAGVAGVIVGLAAQAMLKNLFAGLNLAFGDALRLGDIVEVEGEWGHIEDIALSYVVVKLWDERRLILPTSYFSTNPFRNWSRDTPAITGKIELDVDWRLPVDQARRELSRIVEVSPFWDGRKCGLVVSDATGPLKRLRLVVTASNADKLWELRCEVREGMIDWITRHHPHCMPQLKVETTADGSQPHITAILPMQGGSG